MDGKAQGEGEKTEKRSFIAMAEHEESIVTEKIEENLRGSSTSSSPDSGEEKTEPSTAVKSKGFRLFAREKPLHLVLGGGQGSRLSNFLYRSCLVHFMPFLF